MDDDVLSLSAHGESIDGDSSTSRTTDWSDMLVVDEVGYERSQEPCDIRQVQDDGVYEQYVNRQGFAGAQGLAGETGNTVHVSIPQVSERSSAGAPGPAVAPDTTSDLSIPQSQSTRNFRSRGHQCFVCGVVTHGKMRRHVLKQHLPWFWEPHTACWSCEVQEAQAGSLAQRHTMVHGVDGCIFDEEHMHIWCQLLLGSLHHIREWLDCSNLEELLEYVLQRQLHTFVRNQFSPQEIQLLTFLADHYCPTSMPVYTSNPPNHPICIFNWEIISLLLARLSNSRQHEFMEGRQRMTYEGANLAGPTPVSEDTLVFVDSHFHLDLILRRMRLRNFQHLQSVVASQSDQGFYYGVANYVFPSRWHDWASDVGSSRGVYVSFGIHPHISAEGISGRQLTQLDSLTDNELCVAVGEVGIDYTTTCVCRPCRNPVKCKEDMCRYQEEAFVHMLLLARRKHLPVILHCRDSGDGSAAIRTLEIIRQQDLTHMKFYRHCFVGSMEELATWQQLPHIIFGISGKFIRDGAGLEIIPRIPPHQLVLETDAPFLSPYACCPVNHPWNLPEIAAEVSRLRNTPISVLMWTVNSNAMDFFRIPKA